MKAHTAAGECAPTTRSDRTRHAPTAEATESIDSGHPNHTSSLRSPHRRHEPSRQRHANEPPQTGEARTPPAHQATAEHRGVELVQSSQPAAAKGGEVLCPTVAATASSRSDSHSARRATANTRRKYAPPICHSSVCQTSEMAMRATGADASGEGQVGARATAVRVASKLLRR